jgi:hypothetical protein
MFWLRLMPRIMQHRGDIAGVAAGCRLKKELLKNLTQAGGIKRSKAQGISRKGNL